MSEPNPSLDRKLGNQENGHMKTTLDLPDGLVREIKLRAVREGRKLKDVIADLLRAALSPQGKTGAKNGRTVAKKLPVIRVRPTQPGDAKKLTSQEWCDWLKNLDLQLEVERHEKALGHQHVDRADS
jgi:plasmid stability protein